MNFEFIVRDERELKINLRKIDYEKFLPLKNSLDFKVPCIKAYSYSSTLYHEKMLENIFRTTLNKLAYNVGNHDDDGSAKLRSSESHEDLIRKLDKRKQCKNFK